MRTMQIISQLLDAIMKQILDLGQTSLSESQFRAFRKMTMDIFADGKRSFSGTELGWCGEVSKTRAKEEANMSD